MLPTRRQEMRRNCWVCWRMVRAATSSPSAMACGALRGGVSGRQLGELHYRESSGGVATLAVRVAGACPAPACAVVGWPPDRLTAPAGVGAPPGPSSGRAVTGKRRVWRDLGATGAVTLSVGIEPRASVRYRRKSVSPVRSYPPPPGRRCRSMPRVCRTRTVRSPTPSSSPRRRASTSHPSPPDHRGPEGWAPPAHDRPHAPTGRRWRYRSVGGHVIHMGVQDALDLQPKSREGRQVRSGSPPGSTTAPMPVREQQ